MAQVIESPHPPPTLPRTSIFDYLFPPEKVKGGSPKYFELPSPRSKAFIDGLTGRVLTREQLVKDSCSVAGAIRKLGVKKGHVGLIFGPNSLEWVKALFGCQAAMVVVSPANAAYTPSELLHQIQDSTARLIFVAPQLLPTVQKALSAANAPKIRNENIILLCQTQDKPKESPHLSIEEMIEQQTLPARPRALTHGEESATAYLCYSSGTTGRAKGVETSHHNITSQVQALNTVYEPLKPKEDRVLGVLPFSHIYGLTVVLHQPLTKGIPVIVLPRFEEISVLEAIQTYKITWGLIVPPILLALLHSQNVNKYDISSLRAVQSGAAPLGIELTKAFEKRFGIKVTQGYGLTETSPVTHVMTAEESKGHDGQVGKLMPTFQCRLVDSDTGKDVKKGERGEMWFRGPSVMKGYWRNEDATKNTFAEGGWFKTGDIAVVDDKGYFTVVDRVKELIKYKGFQVAPAELEALLLSHEDIADAAVIGIYDDSQATELPRAYVVPKGGKSKLSAEDQKALQQKIIKWLGERVANHKKLRGGVIFVDAVPKSPSGKILRKDLRVMAKEDAVKETRQAKL